MTQPEKVSIWDVLAEPFPPEAVKERQGPKQHQGACDKQYGQCKLQHKMLSYVDARDVEARLDDAVTPAGWDFMATVATGNVVHGTLVLFVGDRAITRQDFGYPNGDDDAEPIKSAVSDAIKRCAVQFGVGRHLYTDNKARRPAARQNAPQQAAPRPVAQRTTPPATGPQRPPSAPTGDGMTVAEAMRALEGIDKRVISDKGKELYGIWSFKEMTAEQRAHVVEELLGGPVPQADPEEDWGGLLDGAPAA